MLLEAWRDFELKYGDERSRQDVARKLPRRVKKKRQLKAEDGSVAGYEEYTDYIFPDEEDKQQNLKIIEMARKWKKQKVAQEIMVARAAQTKSEEISPADSEPISVPAPMKQE